MSVIPIVDNDGMFGVVDSREFSRLLGAGEVVKFLRGDSWVYPGVDSTRTVDSDPMAWGKRQTDPLSQVS